MAWAETAERLKDELTDKYVVVMDGVPELKRFVGVTGTVKTVNMSGRALVQFDTPADISWYDIEPSYLTVIDAPLPKKKPAEHAVEKPAAQKTAGKPAAQAKAGLSPLEMARQQGAAGAPPAKPAPAADGGKKLSPLEMARQQGAAGAAPAKPVPAADGGKKLSPLEMARQQGAAGSAPAKPTPAAEQAPPAAEAAAAPAEEPAPQVQPPAADPQPTAPAPAADTSGLSKIELARRQGAFKG